MGSCLLSYDEEIRQGGSHANISKISYEVLKYFENNPKTIKADITGYLGTLPLKNSTAQRKVYEPLIMIKALGSVFEGSLFKAVEDKGKITFSEPPDSKYVSTIKRRKQAHEKRIAKKQEKLDFMGI